MDRQRARALRRRSTDAESALWARFRNRQLCGAKFRRQAPVGPYVVDFVCLAARLVVEIDGGQHGHVRRDASRTAWLEREGYRVVRFWNHEVLGDPEAVLDAIRVHLPPRP